MIGKIINRISLFFLRLKGKKVANKIGIKEFKNYSNSFILLDRFNDSSVVIDVGCAEDADFSQTIISEYGVKCFAVDPTKKHTEALRDLEKKYDGLFQYNQLAVGPKNETVVFHESKENQSGSLLDNHVNVKKDTIVEYEVECVTLEGLLAQLGLESGVSLLKLDIEGAEYELIKSVENETLQKIDQIFIEFHHHAVPDYNISDTQSMVEKIENAGFNSFTFDNHNYLFYQN